MTHLHNIVAALLAFVAFAATAEARPSVPPDGVPPTIRYYESISMMSSAAESGFGVSGATELSFHVLGRQFDLKLEQHDLHAQGATVVWVDDSGQVVEPADDSMFLRGRVEGDADSWVRLTRMPGGDLSGIIATGGETYFLEPASRFFGAEAAGETLAYALSDTESDWTPDSCAARHPPKARTAKTTTRGKSRLAVSGRLAAHEAVAALAQALAAGALQRAEIGLVADYEYFVKHGASSAADLADLLNAVDGVYTAEVGVTLNLLTTVIYTTSNDPFSGTTNPSTLLGEASTFRNANDNNPGQLLYGADLAHLVTGRDLDGSTIGIAWLGSLCSTYYGMGVSQDYTASLYNMTLLLAHEMGHNFSAPHDNQGGSACSYEPGMYIMNPSLSGSLQQKFSTCSKNMIAQHVSGASCLEMVDPGPPAPLTLNAVMSPLVIGAPLTLTGSGFTAGSRMQIFVATASGTQSFGPFTPNSRTPSSLMFNQVSPSIPLGNGFGTVVVINTDQNYIASNPQSALLAGNASLNMPTIARINGVALRSFDPTIPLATVETVIVQGTTVTITGSGFNGPLVNLFTAAGNKGPLAPLPGGTSSQFQIVIPADTPTGPGSFQVVNYPYTGNVLSNAVSVPIGALVTISGVTQSGGTVTIQGTGFSTMSVINLFAQRAGGGVDNLGGLTAGGPKVPLTLVDSTMLTFQVPAGAATGAAFVQVLNPPYIPFSSSTNDPDGAFTLTVP